MLALRDVQWRNSQRGRGHSAPPDAAQRENQPTDQEKTRGGEKEKKGKWEERKERKKGKGREKGGRKKEERRERKERNEDEKELFPKYLVSKINQNYNNAVYKWVKTDEFLRGVTILPHPPGKLGCALYGYSFFTYYQFCNIAIGCSIVGHKNHAMYNKVKSAKQNKLFVSGNITY